MTITPSGLGDIADGAKLQGFLPYLEEAINKMEDTLMMNVFQKLDKGTLTPELAMYAWMELLAYRRLYRRFDQKVRIGQAVAEQNQDDLNQ